ncbi:hypothetical protein BKA70DRAFT_745545 [Coprinopsis sp. MPI-PUGE-AT-0042]|nr:hypothetical protein BKA70DRAFT_745545 [Coprinopsis sp. MPI-PUGE-AT-0042]
MKRTESRDTNQNLLGNSGCSHNPVVLKGLTSPDIMYHVQGFLEPCDIMALRKTASWLCTLTKHRNVWLHAARNVCSKEGIPVRWYPIERLSTLDLEHLALSPARFVKFIKANHLETARPGRTQTMYPTNPFESDQALTINKVVLLPGGRFLLTESPLGICLWDLGISAAHPAKSRPIAHRWIPSNFSIRHPRPTPDGEGFMILCCLKSAWVLWALLSERG